MDSLTRAPRAPQYVPIIVLPHWYPRSMWETVIRRYSGRYNIIKAGQHLSGYCTDRMVVLTESHIDLAEGAMVHDYIEYLKTKLRPAGRILFINWTDFDFVVTKPRRIDAIWVYHGNR